MALQASFAEIEITPPIGTRKVGFLRELTPDLVLDPLFARAAVIKSGKESIAFIQLDTISIRWQQVADIRRRVTKQYGFPGEHIIVAATHNHAGPAVSRVGDVPPDEAYIKTMVKRIVQVFGQALEKLQDVELGFASSREFEVAHNRRVVMRDGTVQTHGKFSDPNALYLEGPIDPEVAILAARGKDGNLLGILANFTCHPVHHGPDNVFSAGFPGVLSNEMKKQGCPVTLFLNGALGNIGTSNPLKDGEDKTMEAVGSTLAGDVKSALKKMTFRNKIKLTTRSQTVSLPFRKITEEEISGTVRGAQRFIDPAIYDRGIPALVEKIKKRGCQLAQVQALFLDEYVFVGIPAELFVELGLKIKEKAYPSHALVVGLANGIVGYVPHREAFKRGGYETTFFTTSKLAPDAGDILVETALNILDDIPLEKLHNFR